MTSYFRQATVAIVWRNPFQKALNSLFDRLLFDVRSFNALGSASNFGACKAVCTLAGCKAHLNGLNLLLRYLVSLVC